MGDLGQEQLDGQGLPSGKPRCCGGVCKREGCHQGDEVAERSPSQDQVGDAVHPEPVEGGSGVQDIASESELRDRVRQLHEDIARSKEKRREEIEAAHPRVFGGGTKSDDRNRPVGTVRWEFGYGWDELVENLIYIIEREIDRDPSVAEGETPFQIVEIKEKFAQLRIYSYGGNQRILGAIAMTEGLSSGVCEICGGVGTTHTSGRWLKTLCPECAILGKYDPMPESDK